MTWEAAALIALMFIGIVGDYIKATPEDDNGINVDEKEL